MNNASPRIGIGLMCKPPRPGVSKTRLASSIGADAAARLSEAFLRDCADAIREAATLSSIGHVAYYRPLNAETEMRVLLGSAWSLVPADAGDLGACMTLALADLLMRFPAGAIIMGADIPLITPREISTAANLLRNCSDESFVIAPCADGGYCLIGVKSIDAAQALFEAMTWSHARVLDETLRRARLAGLRPHFLPMQHDIDDAQDLRWLREALQFRPGAAPATRAALVR